MMYSNPYSNAGELQRKRTTHDGQQSAISSTGRTVVYKGCRVPPSAVPSIYYEPLQNSSKARSGLWRFYFHLCTATVQQPNYQRSKGDAAMQNRNRAKSPKGSMFLAADERSKRQLLFSRFLVRKLMDNEKSSYTQHAFHPGSQ